MLCSQGRQAQEESKTEEEMMITKPELGNIYVLLDWVNQLSNDDDWYIGMKIELHDTNGESLGVITGGRGDLSYYPNGDDDG
jgi:hypothetical protein